MKRILFLGAALLSILSSAQDFHIDFSVYGDPETLPDSVVVHNLDQGHSLTLGGQDVLHLVASATGMAVLEKTGDQVEIYPNPFTKKATVMFPNSQGDAVKLSLFDMAGRLLSAKGLSQSSEKVTAEVGGLPPGAYVLHIETVSNITSRVILSYGLSGELPEIRFKGSAGSARNPVSGLKFSKITSGMVDMQYDEGDSLAFTAYLNGLQANIKFVPVVSTTLTFDFQNDREDISTAADITSEGGVLQISDEFGNKITVTFPPGAVLDTVSATLTLRGPYKNLPVDERQLRTFEIGPRDIKLYRPAEITVEYHTSLEAIIESALFHVQTESWLIPLSDHAYAEDNMSISAKTMHFGEFAEGRMTLDQVNAQFDLLLVNLGITWNSTAKSVRAIEKVFADEDDHKKTWDGWRKMAGGFVTFFYLKEMHGWYDSGQTSRQEDQDKLCEKVLNAAVKEVLDLPLPEDLCDRDYTFTVASMVHDMEILGCESAPEYARLNERFDQTLINCASSLVINTALNIESGGFEILTSGTVPIFTTTHISNNATVEGSGTLTVSGSANAGGACSGVISGETAVDVNGNRDAAYTYTLTLNTYQTAVLTTTCPGMAPVVTPLEGAGVQEFTLSLANNFSYTSEEPVEGGTFMMDVVLMNPYTSLPSGDE